MHEPVLPTTAVLGLRGMRSQCRLNLWADLLPKVYMRLVCNDDGYCYAHLAPHADSYVGDVISSLFQSIPQAIHGLL